MAVNNQTAYSWSDLRKQMDPNGEPAKVIDIVGKATVLNQVAVWRAGNLETGHQTSLLISRSGSSKRRFNEGVAPSKNKYKQAVDTCAMYYKPGEIDCDLAEINRGDDGKVGQFLNSQAKADMVALAEDLESDFFYGNTDTDPDSFDGLAARYGDLADTNVVNFASFQTPTGSPSYTSLYAIVWGDETAFMVYPKNSKYGISFNNYGRKVVTDSNGKKKPVYEWDLTQKAGLSIQDPRCAGRICNIDLKAIVSTGVQLADALITLYKKIKKKNLGKLVFFAHPDLATKLAIQLSNRSNAALGSNNIDGVEVQNFWKTPILESELILTTEEVVD